MIYEHIDDIVAKAFQRINLFFRSFISGDVSILVKAYTIFVRPLLKYCTYIIMVYFPMISNS